MSPVDAADFRRMLAVGDRRTTGKAEEVAAMVLAEPARIDALFDCLDVPDPGLRMRAADALEKISHERPELLAPWRRRVLGDIASIPQQEVQWHVAQMIPRLPLTEDDLPRVLAILAEYLATTRSNIVRVMSLQSLADLAGMGWLPPQEAVEAIAPWAGDQQPPSVRSRARRLLARLQKQQESGSSR